MTHEALTAFALPVHAAILVGVLAAYYKFGDRTEITARSLHGTEATLREIRRLLAADLSQKLRDNLAAPPGASPIIVAEATNETYIQLPPNPFESERFRDCVREFVEEDAHRMLDCRNLVAHRDSWHGSARMLSRFLLAFAGYEALIAGALAFLDRTDVYQFGGLAIKIAGVPTVLFAIVALSCITKMQANHDRIISIRHRYADTSS